MPMLTTLLAALALAPGALAADPPEGTVDRHQSATWSGGPFQASNPVQCLDADDPTCDHFLLYPDLREGSRIAVAITPDEGYEGDDYDLYVYDDEGTVVGTSAGETGDESTVFEHTGSSYYEVRVQPWLITPGSTYSGIAVRTREQAIDPEVEECLEPVPESASVGAVTDDGQQITLSVLVLLDGTDRAWAEQVMDRAAEAYRGIGIDLVPTDFQRVRFDALTSDALIDETKAEVGGVRPEGTDVVCTFTDKEMQPATGSGTVVGQADCIGGVRFDNRAFCVVSDIQDIEDATLEDTAFRPNVDATAEVMAHEVGHLMGGHHHYANCVEGSFDSGGAGDVSPCTLMFNAVNFASLPFGTLNGTVVRGHAVDHASP